ncbi:hypothetical protein DFJ64_1524 [Thermasporomyces composti]|uniref:Uncharacterized protein n=1 Tax=Thermasporomyces composti TaxID=696763 RepID=A0A3D9VAT7_THECX|nr:hypothetical protein DFJ64_1524 [Thermasporomyces composti]
MVFATVLLLLVVAVGVAGALAVRRLLVGRPTAKEGA